MLPGQSPQTAHQHLVATAFLCSDVLPFSPKCYCTIFTFTYCLLLSSSTFILEVENKKTVFFLLLDTRSLIILHEVLGLIFAAVKLLEPIIYV